MEHYADKIIEKWINYFVYHKDKMKIRVQYDTSSEERLLKIEAAKHLGDYDLIFPIWDLYNGRVDA